MSHQSTALAPDSPFAPVGRVAKLPRKKAKRQTGFYRRPGSTIWYFRRRIDGVLINESTGFTNLEEAKRWAEERVKALRYGNLGWSAKHVPTVKEYFDGRPRTSKYDKWITPFVAAHAKTKITQITDQTCRDWVATRLETITTFNRPFSPNTVRTECAWLRAFFNHAVGPKNFLRENPWSMVNPVHKVKVPAKIARTRKLNPAEESVFLAALKTLNPMVERMARIILDSGLRRREIGYFQPAMVHDTAIYLPAWLTKGKKARTVPVPPTVLALIDAQRLERNLELHSTERLFPINLQYFAEVFQKACAAAHLTPNLTPHDLRRTYASRLAFKVPVKVLQKLMGHGNDGKVTMEHYIDVDDAQLCAVIASVGSLLNKEG